MPTVNCGSWVFTGMVEDDSFPLSSAFTFTPATCDSGCNVQIDAMIQITWVYDATDRMPLYANSQDEAVADADGWNIDQLNGEGYGWYGLLNDGTTFYSFWNTTGGNGTPNTLYDNPSGWGPDTYFYAVDAAVCFKADPCNNKILGYYFWSWIIDNSGNGTEFITAPAWKDLDTEFLNAVASWNSWAPTSGPEDGISGTDPTKLPNAVVFPPLSNL
jgi:hypothetical protein